ncbi:MAG: type I restriction enzyme HsdR N-terminal domain-containing protein [Desulfobacula sp.]|nr:type I restriction enzyme HsdR N-terminal domain-containing protein [Desulfobacula sp.]
MKNQPNPHHLVLGELKCFLTGSVLTDTLDERYRQTIAKQLVLRGGFKKTEISSSVDLEVLAGERRAFLKVDFLIKYQKKIVALIKYSPGSLVTRRLSTIGLSRIIKPYQIPLAVITNGEDAEVLDGSSGKVIAAGLKNLPDKKSVQKDMDSFSFKPITEKVFEQASRIIYACEVDDACSCDSDICIL